MNIFPAIDLLDNSVVRLVQGDYNNKTVYTNDAEQIIDSYLQCGAEFLHLVDLNGARTGEKVNTKIIEKLCKKPIFVEVGGGIRNEDSVKQMLDIGVKRVILGTAAAKNPDLIQNLVSKYGSAIAVGVDTKDGIVAVSGWESLTNINSIAFCKLMHKFGVETIIYTDISKDGMLQGTNMDAYNELAKIEGLNIVASGGISFEHEITQLKSIGIYGAILGKALFENKIDLAKAIKLARC